MTNKSRKPVKLFDDEVDAIDELIIKPLKDAGLDPDEYVIETMTNILIDVDGHDHYFSDASEKEFWEVAESCSYAALAAWMFPDE